MSHRHQERKGNKMVEEVFVHKRLSSAIDQKPHLASPVDLMLVTTYKGRRP